MIARKPDTSSLRYGYVAFQNTQERDRFVKERDGGEMGSEPRFRLDVAEFGSKVRWWLW